MQHILLIFGFLPTYMALLETERLFILGKKIYLQDKKVKKNISHTKKKLINVNKHVATGKKPQN